MSRCHTGAGRAGQGRAGQGPGPRPGRGLRRATPPRPPSSLSHDPPRRPLASLDLEQAAEAAAEAAAAAAAPPRGGLRVSVFPAGYGLAPPSSTASPARGATILTPPASALAAVAKPGGCSRGHARTRSPRRAAACVIIRRSHAVIAHGA